MRTVARIVSVAGCCLAAALVIPQTASAKQTAAPSQVAIVSADASSVSGVVSSPSKHCVRHRLITFADAATGTVFGSVRTAKKDDGFSLPLSAIPAGVQTVLVTAAAETKGKPCLADSATVAFDEASLSGTGSQPFQGTLTTNVTACREGRYVSVYEVSSDPVFVGSSLTNASGVWTLAAAGGTYYASVDQVLRGSGDAFSYCNGAVSSSWSYEDPPDA